MALENVFGDRYRDIKIVNTKGMTGHTMGASLEEGCCGKSTIKTGNTTGAKFQRAGSFLRRSQYI